PLCDVFEFLQAYDAETVTLRGEIFVDVKHGSMVLRASCQGGGHVLIGGHGYGTAVHIDLSNADQATKESAQRLTTQFQSAVDRGRLIEAVATVDAVLQVVQNRGGHGFGPTKGAPAALSLSAIRDVSVTPLAKPEELPVIPICELFK